VSLTPVSPGGACCDPELPAFRVQRREVLIPNGATSVTKGEVPTGSAFVRIVNTRLTGMGRTAGPSRP